MQKPVLDLDADETILWESSIDRSRFKQLLLPLFIGSQLIWSLIILLLAYFGSAKHSMIGAIALSIAGVLVCLFFVQKIRQYLDKHADEPVYSLTNKRILVRDRFSRRYAAMPIAEIGSVQYLPDGLNTVNINFVSGEQQLLLTHIPKNSAESRLLPLIQQFKITIKR